MPPKKKAKTAAAPAKAAPAKARAKPAPAPAPPPHYPAQSGSWGMDSLAVVRQYRIVPEPHASAEAMSRERSREAMVQYLGGAKAAAEARAAGAAGAAAAARAVAGGGGAWGAAALAEAGAAAKEAAAELERLDEQLAKYAGTAGTVGTAPASPPAGTEAGAGASGSGAKPSAGPAKPPPTPFFRWEDTCIPLPPQLAVGGAGRNQQGTTRALSAHTTAPHHSPTPQPHTTRPLFPPGPRSWPAWWRRCGSFRPSGGSARTTLPAWPPSTSGYGRVWKGPNNELQCLDTVERDIDIEGYGGRQSLTACRAFEMSREVGEGGACSRMCVSSHVLHGGLLHACSRLAHKNRLDALSPHRTTHRTTTTT
jgi:hypothetical protein